MASSLPMESQNEDDYDSIESWDRNRPAIEVFENFTTYPAASTASLQVNTDNDAVNPQVSSPFFHRFPLEIRWRVYSFYWDAPQSRAQHIFDHGERGFASSTCVTSPDETEPSWDELTHDCTHHNRGIFGLDYSLRQKWVTRLRSTWCNHWRCEEVAQVASNIHVIDTGDETTPTPILSVCKLMSHEAIQQRWERTTLCFTRVDTAHNFLLRHVPQCLPHLRSLRLIFTLREGKGKTRTCVVKSGTGPRSPLRLGHNREYYSTGDDVPDKSAWECLFLRLRDLSTLRDVGVYLKYDNYPRKVDERLVLSKMRGWKPGVLTVSVPAIQQSEESRVYDFEDLKGVTVERRERQRYWAVHCIPGRSWRIRERGAGLW